MEIQRKIISDFVGLDSKTYSLIDADNEENKKVKSVNKNVVKNIRRRKCIDVSFNKKKKKRNKMKRIQSRSNKIGTYENGKILF